MIIKYKDDRNPIDDSDTSIAQNSSKKRASHPSSIREPDSDFRKLVDKLEQAEITMKLEETENLKLQYVNNIQITTSQINNINDSDTDLSKKITELLNIYEKNPNFKGKPLFRKWCNFCRRYGHSISEFRQKQQDNQKNRKNIENPRNHFINTRRKIKFYPTKTFIVITIQKNHFQITPITEDNNHPIIRIIEDDHHTKENHEISHKTDIVDRIAEIVSIKITIQNQIQTNLNFRLMPVPFKF